MATNQGGRQAAFRAIGSTTGSYTEDVWAACDTEATLPTSLEWPVPEVAINGAMIAWLQDRLVSSNGSLNGLLAAFAANESVGNWNSLATFNPEA